MEWRHPFARASDPPPPPPPSLGQWRVPLPSSVRIQHRVKQGQLGALAQPTRMGVKGGKDRQER